MVLLPLQPIWHNTVEEGTDRPSVKIAIITEREVRRARNQILSFRENATQHSHSMPASGPIKLETPCLEARYISRSTMREGHGEGGRSFEPRSTIEAG